MLLATGLVFSRWWNFLGAIPRTSVSKFKKSLSVKQFANWKWEQEKVAGDEWRDWRIVRQEVAGKSQNPHTRTPRMAHPAGNSMHKSSGALVISTTMTALMNWFTKYEALAIWLEGIALVLIFIWDRIDARRDHEETIRQIKLAQDQITAMQNAERAWVMAEIEWPKADNLKVVLGSSSESGGPRVDHTTVTVMLTCRNEGRSPAFVDKILAYGEIVRGRLRDLPSPVGHEAQEVATIGALAPGKSATRCVQLTCSGHLEDKELFSIFVSVRYRDIFNSERVTSCGYTMTGWNLYLQDMLPERNKVT